APAGGGLGWNVGMASGDGYDGRADLTWRTRYVQAQAGSYGRGGRRTDWAGVSGAVLVMGGGLFAANRVTDSFVLVDTDGHPGVPVLFENQPVGRTNSRGHLMIPSVPSYYVAKYAIDPLALPTDVRVPAV